MEEKKPIRVALYARVSTDEKHIRRLKESERPRQDPEVQLSRLREYAAAKKYEVFQEYTDRATGTKQDRPAWQKLMADAFQRKFDVLIVTKIDRMARSLVNLSNSMEQLQRDGVKVIFLDQQIDTSGPNGRLLLNVLGSLAEWESEMISTRVKEGMAYGKNQGKKFGRPPADKIYDFRKATLIYHQNPGISEAELSRQTKIPRATLQRYRNLWKTGAIVIEAVKETTKQLPKNTTPDDINTKGA